jgi:hypothetical protein
VRLGGEPIKRVFVAGRLKYSRLVGVRWRTQMDLETLLRAMLEIIAGWGGRAVGLGVRQHENGHPRPGRRGAAALESRFLALRHRGGLPPRSLRPGRWPAEGQRREPGEVGEGELLPGHRFVVVDDLASQRLAWERDKAVQVSQAHGQRPLDLLAQERAAFEPLTPPAAYGLRILDAQLEHGALLDSISPAARTLWAARGPGSGCE